MVPPFGCSAWPVIVGGILACQEDGCGVIFVCRPGRFPWVWAGLCFSVMIIYSPCFRRASTGNRPRILRAEVMTLWVIRKSMKASGFLHNLIASCLGSSQWIHQFPYKTLPSESITVIVGLSICAYFPISPAQYEDRMSVVGQHVPLKTREQLLSRCCKSL